MQKEYYSNGKLLLSGEYAILDGAKGLAMPTKFGQFLTVNPSKTATISWKSLDKQGEIWFTAKFKPQDFSIIATTDNTIATTLQEILVEAKKLNPNFLIDGLGCAIETRLTFPRAWGLGTSSTLINNIALWAKVDAHQLLWNSFGGSGYDISCAQHNTPIVYSIKGQKPIVTPANFNPIFSNALFFVYLNQKQSSKEAIANYKAKQFNRQELISSINTLTLKMLDATSLTEFETLLTAHENLLSKILKVTPVKAQLFSDYFGAVKSLGGWGGDFVLATGNEKTPEYFKFKGFNTVISFKEMLL